MIKNNQLNMERQSLAFLKAKANPGWSSFVDKLLSEENYLTIDDPIKPEGIIYSEEERLLILHHLERYGIITLNKDNDTPTTS